MENNSKDAQMYLKNIGRIADAMEIMAKAKINPKMKLSKEELKCNKSLEEKCCKLEEKCSKKEMVCNWYDSFASYIQEYDTGVYNSACEYADEVEGTDIMDWSDGLRSQCCGAKIIEGTDLCKDCKEHTGIDNN